MATTNPFPPKHIYNYFSVKSENHVKTEANSSTIMKNEMAHSALNNSHMAIILLPVSSPGAWPC